MESEGLSVKDIYDQYYSQKHPETKYNSFKITFWRWKKALCNADTHTLKSGTYPNFTAHAATVQVNNKGEVLQAWIKQHNDGFNMDELVTLIKENTKPAYIETKELPQTDSMLEIPLYDMHFPLSDYNDTLEELLLIIDSKFYDEINLVIGQDLFHNDDFRGRTTSGRPIEKLDMVQAWRMAEDFWYHILQHCMTQANRVNLIYTKGNHDETLAWAFIQRLSALFPTLNQVDDTLKMRKCIYWRECFIGLTHGHSKKNSNSQSLRSIFTIEYPHEFASSKVREIHAGHLHHEEAGDLYGVTVRRLSSAVPTDEWSEDEGFVGAHKRFMIFEYNPGKLKSIYFI